MFRTFVSLVFLVVATATHNFSTIAAEQTELPTLARCQELVKATLPSIVQFSYDGFGSGPLHFGCGVIVSPEGHVAVCGPVGAVLDNKLLELRLTDGRRVQGEALGWSSESGCGMLKITEPGEWKFVKIAEQVKAGEICLALGYPRNYDDAKDHLPRSRLGLVTQAYKDQWFKTSYHSDFSGHPVFNMDGELLGLQANSDGTYSTHSNVRQIQDHWKELTSGVNMDRKRLFEDIRPPQNFEELPSTLSDEALAKAKAATVQIGVVGKKPVLSGVIVPGGYVITCAHHPHLPGDRLEITLADGRSAKVIVRGTNRRTDTCLLKITDSGEWPYVNLGYSSLLPPEKSAVVIGYPIKNNQRPLVLDLKVIEKPDGGLKRRDSLSDKIFLQCNDEEVVTNLNGASGGGVFDTAGNLVGVLSSTNGGKSNDGIFSGDIWNARVELFHKNWDSLTSDSPVEVVDKEVQKNTLQGLTKLMSELKVSR